MPETASRTIDFNKYYSALETVNLMNCQGYVVRVTGSTVESAGPVLGLGELCGIHTRDGRRILAEVVGFRHDHLILLPLEHIEGISPGDAVTARTTPRHILLSEKDPRPRSERPGRTDRRQGPAARRRASAPST